MHDAEHTRTATEAQPDRGFHVRAHGHAMIYEHSEELSQRYREAFDSLVDVEVDGDEDPAL